LRSKRYVSGISDDRHTDKDKQSCVIKQFLTSRRSITSYDDVI